VGSASAQLSRQQVAGLRDEGGLKYGPEACLDRPLPHLQGQEVVLAEGDGRDRRDDRVREPLKVQLRLPGVVSLRADLHQPPLADQADRHAVHDHPRRGIDPAATVPGGVAVSGQQHRSPAHRPHPNWRIVVDSPVADRLLRLRLSAPPEGNRHYRRWRLLLLLVLAEGAAGHQRNDPARRRGNQKATGRNAGLDDQVHIAGGGGQPGPVDHHLGGCQKDIGNHLSAVRAVSAQQEVHTGGGCLPVLR
jgi:hypothetical protein